MQVAQLEKNIKGLQRTLSLPGKGPDKRSARIQLLGLEQKRETLNLQRPNEVIGSVVTESKITKVQTRQVNMWLATLGQSELLDQLQLKAKFGRLCSPQPSVDKPRARRQLAGAGRRAEYLNFINSLDKARNDGIFSEDELRTIG